MTQRGSKLKEGSALLSSPTYYSTLLQTRLHPPQLPTDATPRVRLDALIQRSVERKVLLVTAPAGCRALLGAAPATARRLAFAQRGV